MTGIFISYRRTDSAYALLLYKALSQRFGRARVFRDFEAIQTGQDFVAALEAALSQSAACLVVIGRGWLDAADRLASADDIVRRELESCWRAEPCSFRAWSAARRYRRPPRCRNPWHLWCVETRSRHLPAGGGLADYGHV